MNFVRVHITFSKFKKIRLRYYSQVAVQDNNEYTETPEYPPIVDISLKARKFRERAAIREKIKNINTVEEKQIGLNMPRYYGWQCVMLNENKVPYNAMPFVKFYTRTHFQAIDKLPSHYSETESQADIISKDIKSSVEDVILNETEGIERYPTLSTLLSEAHQRENLLSRSISKQINRIIINNLADKLPHILSVQVDYNPRHEAFWMIGGVEPPKRIAEWKRSIKWLEDRADEPIDRPVQYIGTPMVALRSDQPLKPIIPYSEADNPDFKVPKFTLHPQTAGYTTENRHGTNIPGYWPGDLDEFGLLSYHGRGHILDRRSSFGEEDNIEALHCQAMKASFGWLLAQASYQGFTTYNDLTYPLATQTIVTNGQEWSFYAYQLNTIVMHNDEVDVNPKHNICFGTKPMKLYESIENGKVNGLNEDVLKMIVQMYLNAPEKRDHEMKPYLGLEEQVVADIEDDNKRVWLENRYKHLVANAPRHRLVPEIYHWEYIYKIQHKTRFFEKKMRPFELGINPFNRRLDDHLPPYIPKVLRPYPRCRKKFETTYYPDV